MAAPALALLCADQPEAAAFRAGQRPGSTVFGSSWLSPALYAQSECLLARAFLLEEAATLFRPLVSRTRPGLRLQGKGSAAFPVAEPRAKSPFHGQ